MGGFLPRCSLPSLSLYLSLSVALILALVLARFMLVTAGAWARVPLIFLAHGANRTSIFKKKPSMRPKLLEFPGRLCFGCLKMLARILGLGRLTMLKFPGCLCFMRSNGFVLPCLVLDRRLQKHHSTSEPHNNGSDRTSSQPRSHKMASRKLHFVKSNSPTLIFRNLLRKKFVVFSKIIISK